jgi:hypothetical protein
MVAARAAHNRPRALTMNASRILSQGALVVCLGLASVPASLDAGIPEPDLIWYGKVLTDSGGVPVRVTTGALTWQIEPPPGGIPWNLTAQLTNINDQFSFVLRVRCESPEPGVAATPETVVLTTTGVGYRRMTVLLNGQPLTLLGASDSFAPVLSDRGRAERIDLVLGALPVDSDGNGLADDWERQYFGQIGVDPNADADGDGMTNLHEYRAGTHPTDGQSRFEVVEISHLPGGVQVRWSSQPDHHYRVLRSSNLLDSPAAYQIIQSGIAATPPLNQFVDDSVADGAHFFYRIELLE